MAQQETTKRGFGCLDKIIGEEVETRDKFQNADLTDLKSTKRVRRLAIPRKTWGIKTMSISRTPLARRPATMLRTLSARSVGTRLTNERLHADRADGIKKVTVARTRNPASLGIAVAEAAASAVETVGLQ